MQVPVTKSSSIGGSQKNINFVPITIELNDGNSIQLSINLLDKVEKLKEMIYKQKMLPQNEIDLVYQGDTLHDYETLNHYKLSKGSVIYQKEDNAIERTKMVGFAFNRLVNPELLEFSKEKNGPIYMTVNAGLNLRGKCANEKCEAFQKVIWIQKGMGTFNIGKETISSKCPGCLSTAKEVDNLGFWNCIYSIEGHQNEPEPKDINEKNKIAGNKQFTTFKNDKALDSAKWAYLEITTQKMQ